ncbi:hypothetical protein KSF_095800 [Reticulibacter mediterranei]|uniref:Uncharacterized protein n=1 Tax=Reticulibacter mediterranei TaxID=2778369 RepID=A0A8J3N5Q6_9CHLR|nr:hypothetical protein [Reticulibacter mediterranei]GHO99532.1 hypothetical protein KSF_095800 [Reticulibacter mediterranei]
MAVKGAREKKGLIMYQQPPKKNNNNGFIILGIIAGIVALILILPNFMNKSTTTTTATTYDDSYATPSVASQSHTTFYKNTATPYVAVNNNPWGYDFDNTGNLIYDEIPGNFCDYFKCASDFWSNNRNGYIVECMDGQYSRTGGYANVCEGHGGKKNTLYWH